MQLNELRDNEGATQARKRVGRGIGSGLGKTAGRGHKGQKARSGVAIKGFEGGQMPIHMRLPKRGFNNPARLKFSEVNLERLQRAIDDGKLDAKSPIDANALIASGVVRRARDGVRLLGRGELKAKINLEVAGASASAVKAVEAAGGSVKLLKLVKDTDATERRPKKGKKTAAAKDE
jgi:large subunit ribosomal protein L15